MENKPYCLTVGLSPAIQKTLLFKKFRQGEVNRSERYLTDASGKCINVCRVLTQGGVNAECLTIAGRENRAEFEDLCRRDSVKITIVETSGRVRICTTLIETDLSNYSEIVANEPELISFEEEELFKSAFLNKIRSRFKAVVISGSRLSGFSERIIPFMVEETKQRKILLFADYKGIDLKNSFISEEIRPDFININEEEFLDTFAQFSTLEKGLKEISQKYQTVFIISRGADSTTVADKGEIMEVPSKKIKALNPIGSGDSMIAGITQGILEGLSLIDAVEKGRDYGALNALNIHPGRIKS